MNNWSIRSLMILLFVGLGLTAWPCRFTVREIGFSTLAHTDYTLVVADGELGKGHPLLKELENLVLESNVRVVWLDPEADARHPLLVKAKAQGVEFPNAFLDRNGSRVLPLYTAAAYRRNRLKSDVEDGVVQSPLREKMLKDVHRAFAFVLFVEGKNKQENDTARLQVENACRRVEEVMPLMPKLVEVSPVMLGVDRERLEEERVLLWSMGMDTIPSAPYAWVVYGRGRYMGGPLDKEDMARGTVYRYLAMVGADCECNIDRKWMLGTQLPLLWGKATRQHLAEALAFDVDNPGILAEMSRIMTQEVEGGGGSGSFCPETIDLDEAFRTEKGSRERMVEEGNATVVRVLGATFLGLLVLGGVASVIILSKKK